MGVPVDPEVKVTRAVPWGNGDGADCGAWALSPFQPAGRKGMVRLGFLFVGFQAAGTLGRVILGRAGRVCISGQDVMVRAAVRRIDSYSTHADQGGLLEWIAACAPVRGTLFLVHGEDGALAAMRDLVTTPVPDAQVCIPEIGERWELPAGAAARRLETGREDVAHALGHDWQNQYATPLRA